MDSEIYISTTCHHCKAAPDELAAELNHLDGWWFDNPIEVQERKCRVCHQRRRWWYFLQSRPAHWSEKT